MDTYTIFTSYALVPTGSTFGKPYTQAIHCNYINRMQITTDNIAIQEVRVNFANSDEFKFLNGSDLMVQGIRRIEFIFLFRW